MDTQVFAAADQSATSKVTQSSVSALGTPPAGFPTHLPSPRDRVDRRITEQDLLTWLPTSD